jgi:hypothetical protein
MSTIPNVPTNFMVQSGNGTVLVSWDSVVGAVSYNVLRSVDGSVFTTLVNQTATAYEDTTAVAGTQYWYQVQPVSSDGGTNTSSSIVVTCVDSGKVSLGQVRLAAQQRADMVNSDFITTQEWNSYISHSYAELYDILAQVYGDEYFVAAPYELTLTGAAFYDLPKDFMKLLGVDLSISSAGTGWLTLKKFSFIARNRYIYGNTPVSFLGILNLKYRLVGDQIEFVPVPAANQKARIWYIPRPCVLMSDSDLLDGVSGWDEYVVVDAAIKAMQKEESDVSVLIAQKAALLARIQAAASNRDAGQSETVSDVRRLDGAYFSDDYSNGGW